MTKKFLFFVSITLFPLFTMQAHAPKLSPAQLIKNITLHKNALNHTFKYAKELGVHHKEVVKDLLTPKLPVKIVTGVYGNIIGTYACQKIGLNSIATASQWGMAVVGGCFNVLETYVRLYDKNDEF